MRWLFVGAGNMASSLIGGLLAGDATADQVVVVDPDSTSRQRAEQSFGVHSASSIEAALSLLVDSPTDTTVHVGIVFAVKPDIVQRVCESITRYLQEADSQNDKAQSPALIQPLYLSVAAGVRASSMCSWLPEGAALVRCMPNTPALLGLGVTALYANEQCSNADRQRAELLLGAVGTCIWVDEEPLLDAVTAVSGSGPAYFFYLIEHMTQAGVELGLTHDIAEKLAVETAYGAASMARQGQHSAAKLRDNVTSKGGTTAAALQVFDNRATPTIIVEALTASRDRAVQIGDDLT